MQGIDMRVKQLIAASVMQQLVGWFDTVSVSETMPPMFSMHLDR